MLVKHWHGENVCCAGFCRYKTKIKSKPAQLSNTRMKKKIQIQNHPNNDSALGTDAIFSHLQPVFRYKRLNNLKLWIGFVNHQVLTKKAITTFLPKAKQISKTCVIQSTRIKHR